MSINNIIGGYNMLDEYTLYLDESEDSGKKLFGISGVILKNESYKKLETSISEVKELIWDKDSIELENPVLHSTELNIINSNRKNPQKSRFTSGVYKIFDTKTAEEISDIYNRIYSKITCIIKDQEITTVGCIIDKEKFKELYSINNQFNMIEDWYNIAMQEIIEMYSHFLCSVNGVGSIIYEARSRVCENMKTSADFKMYNNFCKIKVNSKGISHININTLDERLRNLNIVEKNKDNAGLQVADFVAFNFLKWNNINNDNNKTDFMKRIHLAAYNGGVKLETKDIRDYWGIRVLPFDFTRINLLISEKNRMKLSYDNLKKEKNRILKKWEILKNEKDELNEKLTLLEEQIKMLNEEKK